MKYRIEPFNAVHDIWLLQKRTLFLFWKSIGVGPKSEVQKTADTLNAACVKIVKEKTLLLPKTGV